MSRDAGPVKGGNTVIAFVEDPTGYKWELITREEPIPEPIAQVALMHTMPVPRQLNAVSALTCLTSVSGLSF